MAWEGTEGAPLAIYMYFRCYGYADNELQPKDAWAILTRYYGTTTSARKIQLKQKFNNMSRRGRSIQEYVTEITTIADQLASIEAAVSDDDLVAVTLNGLGPEYKAFDTSISVRQDMPDFNELLALLIHEEVS